MADQPPGGGPEPPPGAIRGRVRLGRIVPYATGALVALVAVLLWSALVPGTPPLTQHDVDDTVAKALASVTPAPAFSEQVYAAVRPSLVLIETKQPKPKGATGSDNGLGSGVVVTTAGDILTSLHVVADATEINVTFADGTRSSAQVTAREPEHDIAVIRATAATDRDRARHPRRPPGGPRGERGVHPGQSARPRRLDERRRHLRVWIARSRSRTASRSSPGSSRSMPRSIRATPGVR